MEHFYQHGMLNQKMSFILDKKNKENNVKIINDL